MSGLLVVWIQPSMGTNQYVLQRAMGTTVSISRLNGGWLREGFWIIIIRYIDSHRSMSRFSIFYYISIQKGSP